MVKSKPKYVTIDGSMPCNGGNRRRSTRHCQKQTLLPRPETHLWLRRQLKGFLITGRKPKDFQRPIYDLWPVGHTKAK